MKENIDEGHASERRDTILLSGNFIPVFSQGEKTANNAIQIFMDELRMEVSEKDINVAHRVGKKPANQQKDKQNIIISHMWMKKLQFRMVRQMPEYYEKLTE